MEYFRVNQLDNNLIQLDASLSNAALRIIKRSVEQDDDKQRTSKLDTKVKYRLDSLPLKSVTANQSKVKYLKK